ncbi:MAG: hypothetical protein KAV87_30620 [Desulfobacteraceae bacterium]|nr:hypothetical protein [Desulfobacteraceae bacterium]
MSLSADDKREIREEIWNGFKAFFEEQGLTFSEFSADHKFVHDLRKSTCTVRKASLWTLTTIGIAALAGLVWGAITGKF